MSTTKKTDSQCLVECQSIDCMDKICCNPAINTPATSTTDLKTSKKSTNTKTKSLLTLNVSSMLNLTKINEKCSSTPTDLNASSSRSSRPASMVLMSSNSAVVADEVADDNDADDDDNHRNVAEAKLSFNDITMLPPGGVGVTEAIEIVNGADTLAIESNNKKTAPL